MSSMQTTSPCQPSDGEINTYLLITARILAAVGLSYILRDLYQLIKWPLFSHPWRLEVPDAVAEENLGIDLEDTPTASRVSLDLDFGAYDAGDLGIRIPEPVYHPRGRQ